jgi:iron complex outermembrane receptor protein
MNRKLLTISVSAIALAAAAPFSASPAAAQDASNSADASVETVVVTGTNLRGVAPVGSNLITVGPKDIAATGAMTIEQVMTSVPALTSMGSSGQGELKGSYYQPEIHQLGSSGSTSTLILIDGHRAAAGGTNHTNIDPGLIPLNMLERVEVLADGASSIYGSDAVAGVVNFITRKQFNGLQLSSQASNLNGAMDYNGGILAGTSWSNGSAIIGYTHSFQGSLGDTNRPYTNPNQTSRGGTNFNNFNCSPATLQPGGSGQIYLDATSGTAVTNRSANAPCSSWANTDLLPSETRDNVMLKTRLDFGDNLTIGSDIVYGARRTSGAESRGTVTATAFENGAQANPFYVTPAGYTGTADNETVRWDADDLFGPGAYSKTGSNSMYADVTTQYQIGDNFEVNFLALAGRDDSFSEDVGTINTSVANLAINGGTASSGNLATPSLPGTTTVVTNLPLTTANALDVWNPASSNLTSQQVRDKLLDNNNLLEQINGIQQFRLSTNGRAFDLPAGPVKVAFGTELLRTQLQEFKTAGNNAGPASIGSTQISLDFDRTVYSFYGEADVPIISPDMNVPLMQRFEVDVSGRYDSYSDFGVTANPKIAFNWQVIDDLKLRGNIATSFVAPPLDIVGNQYGVYVNSRFNSYQTSLEVPVSLYPILPQMGIPGCTASSVTCNISSLQGIRVNTGDHNAQPQTGHTWSVGADYTPSFLPGFVGQITLWNAKFTGAITGPQIGVVANTPSLSQLLTFYPNGATQAQINALTAHIPQVSSLPTKTSYIIDVLNSNILNLNVQGIDASFNYSFDTNHAGTFQIGDSLTEFLKFDQSYGLNGAQGDVYSVLNTTGANGVFPSVQTQMRVSLGWIYHSFSANLFVNYTAPYRNWSGSSIVPIQLDAQGNPVSGGDKVDSNTTVDLHLSYNFGGGILGDDDMTLGVRNLFNSEPPFYNSSAGYDAYVANPLGRVISLGFTAKVL